jgi:hypothetical protein
MIPRLQQHHLVLRRLQNYHLDSFLLHCSLLYMLQFLDQKQQIRQMDYYIHPAHSLKKHLPELNQQPIIH